MGGPFPDLKPACAVAEPVCQAFGFLLLDGFSQLAFAAAVETLAAANDALGRAFYDWPIVTLDNAPVRSLAGIALSPDTKICSLPRQAVIVVSGRKTLADDRRRKVIADLRRDVVHGRRLVGIADGVTLLAEAGALVGSRCEVQ